MICRRTHEGKHRSGLVTRLFAQTRIIQGAAIQARRSARLEPSDTEWQLPQALRQPFRRRFAGPSAGLLRLTDMYATGQEGSDRQHDRGGMEAEPHPRDHAAHSAIGDQQVVHRLLEHAQSRLMLDRMPYRLAIKHTVRLSPRRAHRRPLAGIEHPEMNSGSIGGPPHQSAQGIDLAHQMALADAADGRIAAHLAERVDTVREQQGAGASACSGKRRFDTGMTATDHDDVESFAVLHLG